MGKPEEYWNEIYKKTPYKNGKKPTPFFLEMLPKLQQGKVLDVGMGEGVNAVHLAKEGFKVKGFDISSTALDHANKLAKKEGVEIEAKKADLDLFLFGLLEYDSIVMSFFRPSVTRYYSELIRALKQGGTLFVESHSVEEITGLIGKEDSHKNYYFSPNELLRGLKGLIILYYQEDIIDGKNVIRCLAKKPMDKDAAKYDLFDMASKQKDSKMSQQRKLAEDFFKKK